jgi:hypothetical protein
MRVPAPSISLLSAACAVALALAACGGGERTFSADEFVDEVRSNGVELKLGAPLFSDDESKDVYTVELEPLPGGLTPAEGALESPHGSLSVHDDTGGADDQFRNCEATADLLCFQASNVVVVLEGGGLEADRLGAAMKKLEHD